MNKPDTSIETLRQVGLPADQAKIYLELLRGPSSHLKLAHATGINRTKVYRLVNDLEKRSLVNRRTDDRGTFLVASDPATLEVELVTKEEKLREQRTALTEVLPILTAIRSGVDTSNFVIHTYDGVEGFKQMLWHELKTKGENVIFGSGTIDNLVENTRWAEKHRALTMQTNYRVREILNPGDKKPAFTLHEAFLKKYYQERYISPKMLLLQQQISIYNNTVAIYSWRQKQKVGVEIINNAYAAMMRQLFEHYWQLSQEPAQAS